MAGQFAGKVALVTGGATGIGRVGAQLFAREGAKVVVATGRNTAGGNETVKLIEEAGGEAIFVQCDVSKADQVEAMVDTCVKTFGRLDFAFNNAGVGPDGVRIPLYDIVDLPEEIWDQTLDTNLKGVFLCIKYEFKQMIEQGWGGSIVNTSSAAALHVDPGMVAYNCSKAGLTGLTRTAALEGGPHKIRVNAVLPGPIDNTLLWKYLTSTEPGAADNVRVGLPCGRVGCPEDVVETVLWLCSDKASFITGQSVPVDGGLTVQ